MNAITRGVRGTGRNLIRTCAIVIILGVSLGLSLVMLTANRTIQRQIQTTMSSIGTTVTVTGCGITNHTGCQNISQAQIDRLHAVSHTAHISTYLTDHIYTAGTTPPTSDKSGEGLIFTSLKAAIDKEGAPLSVLGVSDLTNITAPGGIGTFRVTQGAFVSTSNGHQALVSEQLAQHNHLTVGSTFTVNDTLYTVSGMFAAGTSYANTRLVVTPISTAQQLFSATGKFSGAVVTADSLTHLSAVTSNVTHIVETDANGQPVADDQPVPAVQSQQDQANAAVQPLTGVSRISLYSLVGSVVASALIMLLTMIMIVRERRREIGILKAIGLKNSRIIIQYMSEASTLTAGGLLAGLGVGMLASNPLTKLFVSGAGSQTADNAKNVDDLRQSIAAQLSATSAAIDWTIILYGAGAAILLALISSALAALIITKVRPAEVLRSE